MGGVETLVLQAWLPAGSQAVDRGAHPPGVSVVDVDAADWVRTIWASGVGAQATDQGGHPPEGFGPVCPGSWATDLGAHQLGFSCVLGLLIQCSQSRGWWGEGARGLGFCGEFSKQVVSASIFSFSFWEIPPIQVPPAQTSTWPSLTQPSLALLQECCSRPWGPSWGLQQPWIQHWSQGP